MHEYLEMKLDYHEEGKVKIDMADYLKQLLDDLPKQMKEGPSHQQQTISLKSIRPH